MHKTNGPINWSEHKKNLSKDQIASSEEIKKNLKLKKTIGNTKSHVGKLTSVK